MGAVWLETTVTRWANGSLLNCPHATRHLISGGRGIRPSACVVSAFKGSARGDRCCQPAGVGLGASRHGRVPPGRPISGSRSPASAARSRDPMRVSARLSSTAARAAPCRASPSPCTGVRDGMSVEAASFAGRAFCGERRTPLGAASSSVSSVGSSGGFFRRCSRRSRRGDPVSPPPGLHSRPSLTPLSTSGVSSSTVASSAARSSGAPVDGSLPCLRFLSFAVLGRFCLHLPAHPGLGEVEGRVHDQFVCLSPCSARASGG